MITKTFVDLVLFFEAANCSSEPHVDGNLCKGKHHDSDYLRL